MSMAGVIMVRDFMTQDVKTEYQVSIDVAFEHSPLTTANETPLQAFGLV